MIVLSHPTAANHSRLMAETLSSLGLLSRFYVGLNLKRIEPLLRFLPASVAREARRRVLDLPLGQVKALPYLEAAMVLMERISWLRRIAFVKRYRSSTMNDFFDRQVAADLDGGKYSAFYGYMDSSFETVRRAKSLGLFSAIEVTSPFIAVDYAIFVEEARLSPEWAGTLDEILARDITGLVERQSAILELADMICVPSRFVARSLPDHVQHKVTLFSYGYPHVTAAPKPRREGGPLRVLFVGGLTQRKGIGYLAQALDRLGDEIELTIVGRNNGRSNAALDALTARATWHPSLPNAEVKRLMYGHDVFVLPSVSEAFGLVVTEALSMGTPVIVSENVGAGDLIEDGVDGFVIPIRDVAALVDHLRLLARDRDRLAAMSAAARSRAGAVSGTANAIAVAETIRQRVAEAQITEP